MSQETQTTSRTLFSGIQPTGTVHIGNYLGALSNWARLQDEFPSYFCVVDYHAITIPNDVAGFAARTIETAIAVLAAGVDPGNAVLFVQSHVPQHTELCWVLNTVTPMGDLHRMTQYKQKAAQHNSTDVGLFDYPVLQAADIMLYRATVVPVGEDQVQHVELTREIARQFNGRYGQTFPEAKPYLTEATRVMGLDGEQKMSKSLGNFIAIDETPAAVWDKLKPAKTDPARMRRSDPGDPERCNIYSYHRLFSSPETLAWAADGCKTAGIGCFDCKKRLAEHMEATLGPVREAVFDWRKRPDDVRDILAGGAARCRAVAAETMALVHERLGLLPARG